MKFDKPLYNPPPIPGYKIHRAVDGLLMIVFYDGNCTMYDANCFKSYHVEFYEGIIYPMPRLYEIKVGGLAAKMRMSSITYELVFSSDRWNNDF